MIQDTTNTTPFPEPSMLDKAIEGGLDDFMNTFQDDGIDLYVPLMIDYEYWFKNSPDNLIKDQIEHIYNNTYFCCFLLMVYLEIL